MFENFLTRAGFGVCVIALFIASLFIASWNIIVGIIFIAVATGTEIIIGKRLPLLREKLGYESYLGPTIFFLNFFIFAPWPL